MNTLKTLAATVSYLVTAAVAMADEPVATPRDTTLIIENADRVTVVKSGDRTVVDVVGPDECHLEWSTLKPDETSDGSEIWGLHLPFLGSNSRRARVEMPCFRDIYYGMLWGLNAPATELSWECGISEVIGLSFYTGGHGPEFNIGFGFAARTLNFGSNYRLDCKAGQLSLHPRQEGTKVSSRIDELQFKVPVRIIQPIYRSFFVAAGVDVVLNTYCRAHTTITTGDIKTSEDYKGLRQRVLRPEIVGALGWTNSCAFYCRYSPVATFKAANGPSFATISAGFSLNF